jgi:hypothetical protein
MGCKPSKVVASTAYGMGGAPQHSMLRQSAKHSVAILWDMDDVKCPPSEEMCIMLVCALRQVYALLSH